jgi:hypothetical protein
MHRRSIDLLERENSMRQENRLRNFAFGLAIAAALTLGANSMWGQSTAPSISPAAGETTDAQLITCTVSQAWRLSGRNEAAFFDIVQQLAAISAKNRSLMLPDNAAAGRRAGEYIKQAAKADHNQLLYVIVDKAVQKVGTPAPATTAAK